MDVPSELKSLRIDLEALEKPELIDRIMSAYNSLALVNVMLEAKMAILPTVIGTVNMAKKDLRGERGESF
jgi:hypothetical protein